MVYPVLFVNDRGLVASYSRVDVEVRVSADCKTSQNTRDGPNYFIAPSMVTALEFVGAVEGLRQRSETPYLQCQTGYGPSSKGIGAFSTAISSG